MSDHRAPVSDPGKVDADLIERCYGGDAEAWDALFDKYYAPLRRVSYSSYQRISARRDGRDLPGDIPRRGTQPRLVSGKEFVSNLAASNRANKAMDFRGKSRAEKRGGSSVHFSLDGAERTRTNRFPLEGAGPDALLSMPRPVASSGKASINWTTTAARSLSCAIMAI